MQLPVDVGALMGAVADIEGARALPLSVNVLIDETAPGDVIGHVRSAFASASASVRVTIGYLGASLAVPNAGDDVVVLVAGLSERVGAHAASVRKAGVPAMVVTTLPQLVNDIATVSGNPIPAGDVVFPERVSRGPLAFLEQAGEGALSKGDEVLFGMGRAACDVVRRVGANAAEIVGGEGLVERARAVAGRAADVVRCGVGGVQPAAPANGKTDRLRSEAAQPSLHPSVSPFASSGIEGDPAGDSVGAETASSEPIVLDERASALLDQRMGEWIIDACAEKRLAFALAFPFVRRPLSAESVFATSAQNAGIGLVLFIPGADMPIMTLNQAKMLLQIAAAYGQPLDARRVKELAVVVGGAFACRTAARQLTGLVPALGWAVKAGIGYAGTFAMGRAAIEYFEGGGNIGGMASVVAAARDKAVDAAASVRATARG